MGVLGPAIGARTRSRPSLTAFGFAENAEVPDVVANRRRYEGCDYSGADGSLGAMTNAILETAAINNRLPG